MLRLLLILAAAAAVLLAGAGPAWAQGTGGWPAFPIDKGWRGPGYYLSVLKVMSFWLVFVSWVWTTDWVNRDVQEMKLNYLRWNPVVFGTFIGAMVLAWFVPYFWFDISLLAVAYVAPLATYVIFRNKHVMLHQKVLTRDHLRYWFSQKLKPFGVKMAAEAGDRHEKGPPVKIVARGGPTERDENARSLAARQHPGLFEARKIVADGLGCRATAIMLDFTQQAVAVRYLVDGVWLNRDPVERRVGDPALEALKLVCGMNPQERQARQGGPFLTEFNQLRYAATLAAQGTAAGERALVQFEEKEVNFGSLDELGMRTKMQEQLKELLAGQRGLFLFSGLPANGLRTMTDVSLRATDRLTRDFAAVEDEGSSYRTIENVQITTYKAADGQGPADVLTKVFRTEPDVVVVRDLVDAKTVLMICEEAREDRLVLSTIRSKDAPEALLRVAAMKVPTRQLAPVVIGVLNTRLIRKLCDGCKEAYAPTPEVLKQLGIPPGKIQALYRPPQQPPEKVCQACGGIGYVGRTAIFELLVVGDNVRKVLANTPKLDLLRAAARKDGMRTLQEEGVLLVARGVTSLPELMRVLKQ